MYFLVISSDVQSNTNCIIVIRVFFSEPVPPEQQTKRKYERDFLVQFQYMQVCMEKPANLPDLDVILDVPQPPQSRTGSSGGGSQR